MIPKILTAILSAAILSAVLGALPCEATGVKPHAKAMAVSGTTDLNSPSADFSTVTPVIDDPQAERLKPKAEKQQFFGDKVR